MSASSPASSTSIFTIVDALSLSLSPMVDAFIDRVACVKKLLERLKGKERENAAKVQASTLKKMIADMKAVSLEMAEDLEAKVSEIGMPSAIKNDILDAINH